ncbi:MAG: pilin [Candidatus Moraniibacteriota bacterium]
MRNFAQFARMAVIGMVLGIGFFAILPGSAQAQTCKSATTTDSGTCFDTATQTCSGTQSSAATGCSGSLLCCYGTVSNTSSSTCTGGTCKASCDVATEDEKTSCSGKPPTGACDKDSTPKYCVLKSSGGGGTGGTAGQVVNISLVNPLKYNTVQQVLMALLYALQGVIVVLSLVFIVIGAVLYITSGGNQGRVTMAKTAITAALIGLAIGILAPTFLKEIATVLGWNATAPLPSEVSNARSAADILLSVLNFLLGIVGTLSIIMLVIGGGMFLTAAGSQDRITTGKKIVTYALLGVVVALASLVIVRQLAAFFAGA